MKDYCEQCGQVEWLCICEKLCEECEATVTITFEPYGSSQMAVYDCPNCGVSYDTNLDPVEGE